MLRTQREKFAILAASFSRAPKVKSEKIKKLVVKSESAAVEFKRARGGVPADFWPPYSAEKTYNHPSGDLAPSKGDLDLPCRLAELSEIAQIRHLDHLSVTTTLAPQELFLHMRATPRTIQDVGRDREI